MGTKKKNFVVRNESVFVSIFIKDVLVFKVAKGNGLIAKLLGDLPYGDFQINFEEVKIKAKQKTKKKKKTKKEKEIVTAKAQIKIAKKAKMLHKRYCDGYKEFYGYPFKEITINSKDYEHFMKAGKMIIRLECSVKAFFNAQIAGLKFTSTYPKLNNLSTYNAEQRFLDYTRMKNMTVELTDEERATELQSNKKYVRLHKKIKGGTATLEEAVYVRECQYARKGETQMMVDEYIKELKKA